MVLFIKKIIYFNVGWGLYYELEINIGKFFMLGMFYF